jgi:beta-lactam-binding protein with PASTA domain
VDFVGTVTWTVTFRAGVYQFVCDPHAGFMNGTFGVDRAPPVKCKVPRVIGKKLPAARRAITRARCRVGRVRRARSLRAQGRVLSQTPRAGITRPKGTRVNLVVSRGRR